LLARLPALPRRRFDPDEFEHAHAAWCVFRGMLPYRDFFEHHTPWYYYALRPLFHWFTVEASFDDGRHFLLASRIVSLLLTAASLAIVVAIGRRWMHLSRNATLVGSLAAVPPLVGLSLGMTESPIPAITPLAYLGIVGATGLLGLLAIGVPTRLALRARPITAIA